MRLGTNLPALYRELKAAKVSKRAIERCLNNFVCEDFIIVEHESGHKTLGWFNVSGNLFYFIVPYRKIPLEEVHEAWEIVE